MLNAITFFVLAELWQHKKILYCHVSVEIFLFLYELFVLAMCLFLAYTFSQVNIIIDIFVVFITYNR